MKNVLPHLDITDIEYLNTEQMGFSIDEAKSNFDLSVLLSDGSRIIVEMQKTNLRYFNYRSVYYFTHAVQLQARNERERQREALKAAGERPFWNYHFQPVYFIGVLLHGMGGRDSESGSGSYVERYRLREVETGEDMKFDGNFIYLRLDRFDKSAEESVDPIDRFIYSLKHISGMERMPESFEGCREMDDFYDIALEANQPPEIRHEIEIKSNMTTENDILVAIAEAREDAAIEGMAEGMAKGLAEGLEKGKSEGKAKAAREIAGKLKSLGLSAEDIAKATGLTEEEIKAL